jgi:hypothetical protein
MGATLASVANLGEKLGIQKMRFKVKGRNQERKSPAAEGEDH